MLKLRNKECSGKEVLIVIVKVTKKTHLAKKIDQGDSKIKDVG